MPILIMSVLLSLANAEEPKVGTYNDTELARQSVLFGEASKISAPKFANAEGIMSKHNIIIQQMESNLALAGLTETPEWYQSNLRYMLGYRQQIAVVVNLLTTAYDTEFTAARDRAIEALSFDGEITPCEAQSIHALMGSTPKCDGVDLNKEIASRIDKDNALNEALTSINSQTWPEPQVQQNPMEPIVITGTDSYIQLEDLTQQTLAQLIKEHQAWLERQNDNIIEGLESGDPEAIKLAKEQRKEYLNRLSQDGEVLQEVLKTYTAKRGKKYDYLNTLGICVNHRDLGGCTGKDVTQDFIQLTDSDKYWLKLRKKTDL